MKLESQLGIPYKTWMNLHNGYMYECKALDEKRTEEQYALQFEDACANIFNIQALYKRLGLIMLSCSERVKRLKELFSFDLLSSNELRLQVAGMYKHSEKVQMDEKNMLTWLILNRLEISRIQPLDNYQKGNAMKAAEIIARMANERTLTTESINECLNSYGISYIKVEKLDKTPIDAYSTFTGDMPVITVTYRYNDMDKLAFDILHELCHIDRHFSEGNKAFISIEGIEYSNDPREKEANEFARQMLIPDETWENILKVGCTSLSPYKIVKTIATEAERCGISPSIAISRYKHDTNWYRTSTYKSPKIF
jgi:HTH-type transcriptional regulator/antitoxin HigA